MRNQPVGQGDVMDAQASAPEYRDRRRVIVVMGAILLLGGIAVGLLGPLEMYCFYLFSEGGRFYYEGFGFGSFMFGNIASQIVGYYLIAAVLIPLGYGHLKVRRWARTLTVALLWSWMVVGAPLTLVVSFVLVASKDLSLPVALIVLAFLGLSYLALPGLLIRFYQGRNVRRTFEARDAKICWIEALPTPILVLSALYLFYAVMLHILILFNGMFPAFGIFRFGLQGIVMLDISIACLLLMTWGTLRRRPWAWWLSVVWMGLFTFSTLFTLVRSSYATILSGLAFPPLEMEMLGGLPLQGHHYAVLVGPPLLITWIVAVLSRRHFGTGAGPGSPPLDRYQRHKGPSAGNPSADLADSADSCADQSAESAESADSLQQSRTPFPGNTSAGDCPGVRQVLMGIGPPRLCSGQSTRGGPALSPQLLGPGRSRQRRAVGGCGGATTRLGRAADAPVDD